MYVYIIHGDTYKRTPQVLLDFEKCVPCVGAYLEMRVDPAQWFKVLVVGAVLVDCDCGMVYWMCEENIPPCDTESLRVIFKQQEWLSAKTLCQNLNPQMEELFESTRDIFTNLSPDIEDGEDLTKLSEEIMKLLHLYVLPEIRLEQKHLKLCEGVVDRIETKEHENIEMLIQMNLQMKRTKEEELTKKRKVLIEDTGLELVLEKAASEIEFLEFLLKHTEKDLRKLKNAAVFQTPVADLQKGSDLHSGASKDNKKQRIINELERKEKARRNILNATENFHMNVKPKNNRHIFASWRSKSARSLEIQKDIEDYVKETQELESIENDLNQSINTKIRLASIREATWLACDEIKKEGSTFGYQFVRGSKEVGFVDFLASVEKPKDWSTLKDQIRSLLRTEGSKVKTEHELFCEKLKAKCTELCDGPYSGYCLIDSLDSSIFDQAKQAHDESLNRFSTRWLTGSISRDESEHLCKEVTEHIHTMAYLFEEELGKTHGTSDNLHQNIYICYEECLSLEIMLNISEVYEHSFQAHCMNLSRWIQQHAVDELEVFGLTMQKLFPSMQDTERKGRGDSFVGSLVEKTENLASAVEKAWSYLRQYSKEDCENEGGDGVRMEEEKANKIKDTFGHFFEIVKEESKILSLFGKLRQFTDAIQFLSIKVTELNQKLDKKFDFGADDMLDVLVLVLCQLDSEDVLSLYAHANMCLSLVPDFLHGTVNEYSLITVIGAFQHLFERRTLHGD